MDGLQSNFQASPGSELKGEWMVIISLILNLSMGMKILRHCSVLLKDVVQSTDIYICIYMYINIYIHISIYKYIYKPKLSPCSFFASIMRYFVHASRKMRLSNKNALH